MKLNWENKQSIIHQDIDETIQSYLFQDGSLTRYLQQQCKGIFQIELKSEAWHTPMPDEATILGLNNNEDAFIRESWLKSDNIKLVYARTIIPRKTLIGETEVLANLGTKPLGEILFADESTYRAKTHYAKIPTECDLYTLITDNISNNNDEGIWGRQSLFYIQDKPLLISEIFLPEIKTCIKT